MAAPRSISCPPAPSPSCRCERRNRSSIVWTERTADAERLVAADDLVFEIELEQRFGLKLGEIRVEGKPRAWPLGLTLARAFVAPRIALAGDAAHGIHPIAGQGLNLGFKDAAALAEMVVEADRLGQDIGALDVLERYQQLAALRHGADGRHHRCAEPAVFQRFRPAARDSRHRPRPRRPHARMKEYFIGQASGLTGDTPRLLQGEAI